MSTPLQALSDIRRPFVPCLLRRRQAGRREHLRGRGRMRRRRGVGVRKRGGRAARVCGRLADVGVHGYHPTQVTCCRFSSKRNILQCSVKWLRRQWTIFCILIIYSAFQPYIDLAPRHRIDHYLYVSPP